MKPNRRDELITMAGYGKITPEQAEAEAKANGWEPFEQQPRLPDFDPIRESRWSITMTIAWIAWRDMRLVRENSPGFASRSTHWIFREWNEPVDDGKSFARRKGWFLDTWHEATMVRLCLLEAVLRSRDQLPEFRKMTIREAERTLWQSLSDGGLIAEGINSDGKPVEIPQREWSYLKIFEERERDTLKYDAFDRREAFTKVKLKRDDILALWPRPDDVPTVNDPVSIEPHMLAPISKIGKAGYVPLCASLQWIMTNSGARNVMMDDTAAWNAAVQTLWPRVCSGDIELIGMPRGSGMTAPVPGNTVALVRLLPPLDEAIGNILLNAPSHIICIPYIDHEHWLRNFNDKLYETGRPVAAWTHLQVLKSQILAYWPRSQSSIKPETDCYNWLLEQMQQSPERSPKPRTAILNDATKRFPKLKQRQFERAWRDAVRDSGARGWSKAGRRSKKSNRSAS